MHLARAFSFVSAFSLGTLALAAGTARAHGHRQESGAQICSVGFASVGQPGTLICKDTVSGVTTQAFALGLTASAANGIGGSLASRGDRVLVTNQVGGAVLLRVDDGVLKSPVNLDTGGEASLSGALGERGAYVLTGTELRFFPYGQTAASSSRKLLLADGSAAQVTLARGHAYVSEKNGTLEVIPLGFDGRFNGPVANVAGVSPGVIVGITGVDDQVVAPIAHLASNFPQAEISVVSRREQVQRVPTKEVAACWAASDDEEVCVTNPGSMTVSCGAAGSRGLESYTSAAASLPGESVFDLDMRHGLVGIQGINAGQPVLLTFRRTAGDFLMAVSEFPVGTARAAGALLLPPLFD